MIKKINLKYYRIVFIGTLLVLLVFFIKIVNDIGSSDIWPAAEYTEIVFDKELWINNKEDRYMMSKNLIESKVLIGKNLKEVTELLGTDYSSYTENTISYYLGFIPSSVGNLDPDLLELTFENDKVIKIRQHGT